MTKKILVLGGHGFIGTSLIKALQSSKYGAIALSRRDGFDLFSYERTRKYIRLYQPDVIVNLAAHTGGISYLAKRHGTVLADNSQMALNLYRAVQEVCPQSLIVNPLSNCSYPGEKEIYNESEWLDGQIHPSAYSYGNAKRFIHTLSGCYASQFGLKTSHYLIPNAFGPGDSTDPAKVHALNGMIIRMLKAEQEQQSTFEIWGSGQPIREWIYVEDIAKILAMAIDRHLYLDEPLNLAQGRGYTIRESAVLIAKAIGFTGELVFRKDYPDGAAKKIMNPQKFQQVFQDYQFFDHYDAICQTVDYYRGVLFEPTKNAVPFVPTTSPIMSRN
jgi:GDP-L-fucose synthase